jgi:hypothetical protein
MMTRNVFRDLADLPDKARLGVNLIVGGLAVLAVRYLWPHVGPASFQRASTIFYHYSPDRHPSLEDLGIYLVAAAVVCLVSGAFIFLRRAFWWVAEHRDEESITELRFK